MRAQIEYRWVGTAQDGVEQRNMGSGIEIRICKRGKHNTSDKMLSSLVTKILSFVSGGVAY